MTLRNVQLFDETGDRVGCAEGFGPTPVRAGSILQPGRNCWRIAHAHKALALIDGAEYFAQLEATLRHAERSIIIIGWDFDGSIRLRPDVPVRDSPLSGPC